jgi:pyruvate carboxylase subunit B
VTAKARPAPRLRLTDTTFRDAHQSLLAGRLRGEDIVRLAVKMDEVGFYSLEAFGGATFETEIRYNGENPWEYLRQLKKAAPKTPIQALVRGQNLVAHRNFADDVVQAFIAHAADCGVDIFRIFDPLNDLRNMEAAIAAAKKAKRKVQGALCYAISPAHNLELWCTLAKGLQKLGCDVLVIKDTSGLLSPQTTWELVAALREVVKIPIGVHSHCSSGMAPMAYMAAVEAGATILDTAISPLAWGTSQPATESVVAALAGGDYDTGIDLEKLIEVRDEVQKLKEERREYLSPFADRVDADILRFQVPGHMLEDVHQQLRSHGAEGRLKEALEEIPRVRKDLGYPPLVAPIRQLIATQAVLNVIGGERYATVTKDLKDYLQGLFGRPPRPADPELRQLVLGREEPVTIRPADLLEPQLAGARAELKRQGVEASTDNLLTYLLFPSLALSFFRGDLARKTPEEPGKNGGEEAVEASDKPAPEAEAAAPEAAPAPPPAPSAEFQVEVEGETFVVRVTGAGIVGGAAPGGSWAAAAPAAAPPKPVVGPGSVVAPMQGLIVKVPVKVGDEVKLGDVVAVLEAMKMQNDIVTTVAGKVKAVHVKEGEVVGPNQPLVNIG